MGPRGCQSLFRVRVRGVPFPDHSSSMYTRCILKAIHAGVGLGLGHDSSLLHSCQVYKNNFRNTWSHACRDYPRQQHMMTLEVANHAFTKTSARHQSRIPLQVVSLNNIHEPMNTLNYFQLLGLVQFIH